MLRCRQCHFRADPDDSRLSQVPEPPEGRLDGGLSLVFGCPEHRQEQRVTRSILNRIVRAVLEHLAIRRAVPSAMAP